MFKNSMNYGYKESGNTFKNKETTDETRKVQKNSPYMAAHEAEQEDFSNYVGSYSSK
jgi:hypothetical protein